MTLGPRDLVVLDTTVVINVVRDNAIGREIERRFQLRARIETPLISSVTRGEAGALTEYWGWGAPKITQLQRLLDQFVTVDAGEPLVIESYSMLHARSLREGRRTGDNDLWIAATCIATHAQLITNDADFDWLHPSALTRHYIAAVS